MPPPVDSNVTVTLPDGQSAVVLICEHASAAIPDHMNHLGLDTAARRSHAAWDPGAFAVAKAMSARLDATLLSSNVSRLVYDCNRPPGATDAMPSRVEAYTIPGNCDLTPDMQQDRQALYYDGFEAAVANQVAQRADPVIVTIHSFAPVYNGTRRRVELGILHDRDSRLADAMLSDPLAPKHRIERNAPYSAKDGVTHTLKRHALPGGFFNVMIEIRNDLIATQDAQNAMATALTNWLLSAVSRLTSD